MIVCGFGHQRATAAAIRCAYNVPFLVVERKKLWWSNISRPTLNWLVYIVGDGTDDEVLKKAGRSRRALITALPTDADNVFIV